MINNKKDLMKEAIFFHRVSEEGQYFCYVLWTQVRSGIRNTYERKYFATTLLSLYLRLTV